VLVAITIAGFFVSDAGYDWTIYREAGERAITGGLYEWEGIYAWSYSPPLAYAFTVLAPIGFAGWSILHVLALLGLRDVRLIAITAVSWPFWVDLYNGNTMTFVFVAAVAALRGSTFGSGAYLSLALLMPRPLMLPLMAWILWKQPRWRLYFPILAAVFAVLVLATGQGGPWLQTLTGVSEAVAATSRDIGPGAVIGAWWLPVGAALALILTYFGRLGIASIAASPYWLPQYLLMALLELVSPDRVQAPGLGAERDRGDEAAGGEGRPPSVPRRPWRFGSGGRGGSG
jgi:hypothetical protein